MRRELTAQSFAVDATLTSGMLFLSQWLLFAWIGLSPLSNVSNALFIALVNCLLGPYAARSRRNGAIKRGYVR
jgi:hypothetical protein